MSYIVLARKWRPLVFEDVIGQEHITHILMNALKNQRIAHAFIFAGPRGVGKTSTARLLAKAVNCEKQPVVNPCNECSTCKSITEGHSLDVIEIDGASNRGIDEIRNLRENIRFAPASCRFKIYIIDEVHMLTKEAFNALLKTLEEPPAHTIFIFATTEIHRVPLTILSRCQRFDFKRISVPRIQQLLKKIVQSENVEIEDEALLLITKKADGSMRDAESILDQMISLTSGKLTADLIRNSLGLISQELFFDFTDLLQKKDTAKILQYANDIFSSGYDLIDYLHGLQEHFRNFLIANALNDTNLLDVTDHLKKRYQDQASQFVDLDLIHYLNILTESEQMLKYSYLPELSLEMILLKLAHKPSSVHLEEILSFIEETRLTKEHGNSGSSTPGVSSSSKIMESHREKKVPADSTTGNVQPEKGLTENAATTQTKGEFAGLGNTVQQFQKLHKTGATQLTSQHTDFDINLSEIQEKWAEIVKHVCTQKIALGSFLQEGVPYQTEKGKLIIAYDRHTAFHKEHVEKNSKIIEGILKNDFNLPLRIGFKSIDFKSEGIKQVPRTPEEILEDIKNKEPIIRKIIDVFDLDQNISRDI
jgi:DNA polymerase-3 subunit gamma/tau